MPPPVLVIDAVLVAGSAPPVVAVKLMLVGATLSTGWAGRREVDRRPKVAVLVGHAGLPGGRQRGLAAEGVALGLPGVGLVAERERARPVPSSAIQ